MSAGPVIFAVSLIIFLATVFRSAFGFGESLVAVPLLALFMPIDLAVPLSVLVSVTIAGFVVVQDHKEIHFKSAGNLTIYAIMGIPTGLWLLVHVEESLVKVILGLIIILFAIYLLTGKKLTELRNDDQRWLFGCGFLSGVLGGAYGINGPPLVVYGAKRRWSAQHFRATLQAYFLIASMVGLIGYGISGLFTWVLFSYYCWSLPALISAILLGRFINARMKDDQFFSYSYIVLIGLGILLIANSAAFK
ncbi:sulfite exporter TauE/SafE family protein [Pedobacter ghigonis]|uniref:sulfite exporter TauE/SafE family protein n=1 Tax=Pedobacter ghigonis TaxID=2730403 RepID=UPI00158C1D1B|nr:sulfite exporter TauE/SafE family protein [Pedobacter ghigonis]